MEDKVKENTGRVKQKNEKNFNHWVAVSAPLGIVERVAD